MKYGEVAATNVNGIELYVVQNDISQEPVEAIICPTDTTFDPTGKVFQALIRRGGNRILNACKGQRMLNDMLHISR